jgi:hypothetical protein
MKHYRGCYSPNLFQLCFSDHACMVRISEKCGVVFVSVVYVIERRTLYRKSRRNSYRPRALHTGARKTSITRRAHGIARCD